MRPESQTAPVEANVNGTSDQAAVVGSEGSPGEEKRRRARSATCATSPPLTSVSAVSPQARACGSERKQRQNPHVGVPG